MQPTIVIDTAAFAVPNDLLTGDDVDRLVKTILSLSVFSRHTDLVSLTKLERAIETLWQVNAYPVTDNIRALIELFGLQGVYTPRDVTQLYNELLNRLPAIEDGLPFSRLEIENIRSSPDILSAYATPEFRRDAERLVAICTLAGALFKEDCSPLTALMTMCGGRVNATTSATFLAIEPESVVAHPASYFSNSEFVDCFDEWIESCWVPFKIWEGAEKASHYKLAIALEVFRYHKAVASLCSFDNVITFHIGESFCKSLAQNAASGSGSFSSVVFEACWRLLAGIPKTIAAGFPSDKYGGQRVRADGASAYRMHITEGGVGLRLMYWRRPDGTIELANIGPKAELDIS